MQVRLNKVIRIFFFKETELACLRDKFYGMEGTMTAFLKFLPDHFI